MLKRDGLRVGASPCFLEWRPEGSPMHAPKLAHSSNLAIRINFLKINSDREAELTTQPTPHNAGAYFPRLYSRAASRLGNTIPSMMYIVYPPGLTTA